jgi:cytochrome P450 family 3 subfamily A
VVFPFLTRLAPTLESDTATKIAATMQSVMSARRKSGQTRNDFVDILNSMMDKISTSTEYKRLKITETTVMAQGINFVLAGYDAKCTTVTMLLYNLAKYEEIQNIVLNEIDSFVESNDGEIPYEKIGELPHLQACLQETLRLYPPFIRPERICTKDWEHDGIRIKKGLLVMAPAWAVNRNPQIYPNPDNFDPTRFLPENKASLNPYAFSTFGAGPRGCIGVRYAMDAMKFSLCHILKNYRFRLCSDTKINYKTGVLFLVMYDSVNLEIVRRTP